jgi:hypothetical protein
MPAFLSTTGEAEAQRDNVQAGRVCVTAEICDIRPWPDIPSG